MNITPITVTEVSNYIKSLLDTDGVLSQLCICGELSNYKMHSSGHHYFTLKDDTAVISAVMFRGEASKLRFRPESGMKVIITGRVSAFPKSGQYQIYVSTMQPDGVGDLHVAFEQLKQKLYDEGLFDAAHKKALPKYPKRIALVTSSTGAAVRDMIRILNTRFPLCEVIVCPTKVQGEGAAQEIAQMLLYVDTNRLADVIITGRGGGSIEDLWAFNEEIVARAIYNCKTPIISAVGHEPDVTIADFVADVRAATPSNAAELAVVDSVQLRMQLSNLRNRVIKLMLHRLSEHRQRLELISRKKIMTSPYEYLNERKMLLDMLGRRVDGAMANVLAQKRQRFVGLASTLDAISPLKVLCRGYSMVTMNDKTINSIANITPQSQINVRFSDGMADCTVNQIKAFKKENKNG